MLVKNDFLKSISQESSVSCVPSAVQMSLFEITQFPFFFSQTERTLDATSVSGRRWRKWSFRARENHIFYWTCASVQESPRPSLREKWQGRSEEKEKVASLIHGDQAERGRAHCWSWRELREGKNKGRERSRPKGTTTALWWMTLLKARRGRSPRVKSFLLGARRACADFTVY